MAVLGNVTSPLPATTCGEPTSDSETRKLIALAIASSVEEPVPIFLSPDSDVVTGYYLPSYEQMEAELEDAGFFEEER